MLKVGQLAPDFQMGDRTLHETLAERAVTVFFFPKAFTAGCTREARQFQRQHHVLSDLGVELVGVSADPQEVSDRFRKELGLDFLLIGDPERVIIDAYDVRWPIVGAAQRITYMIRKDGTIRMAFHSELRMNAHAAAACRAARDAEG